MNKYGCRIGTCTFALEYTIQDTDTNLKPLHKLRVMKVCIFMACHNTIQYKFLLVIDDRL